MTASPIRLHLTVDPYTCPGFALLAVADEQPCSVMELRQRVKAAGYALAQGQGIYTFLARFISRGLMERKGIFREARYMITAAGRQYREAVNIQLPPSLVRMLTLLTPDLHLGSSLATRYAEQFGLHRSYGYSCLTQLQGFGLVERSGGRGTSAYRLTSLGQMTQADLSPACPHLGLPVPVQGEGAA